MSDQQQPYFPVIADVLEEDDTFQFKLESITIEDGMAKLLVGFSSELRNVARDWVLSALELDEKREPVEDWDDPKADLGEGSPTWNHALETLRDMNANICGNDLLDVHGPEISKILASFGHEHLLLTATSPYTVKDLMAYYRQFKAQHLAKLHDAGRI